MDVVRPVTDAYLASAQGTEAARLRFLQGIWEIQSEVAAAERAYQPPTAEAARAALASGQPLFLVAAPVVPLDVYREAASRIARYVSENAGLAEEQAQALREADFESRVDEALLAEAVRAPEAFASKVIATMQGESGEALTEATVAFVLIEALVPFLTGPAALAVKELGGTGMSAWKAGHCPICGAAASLGRMGESTQTQGAERTLWCGVCHAEWTYERIRCVRCGCRNPDKLRYTHLEGDPAHRLHLCDECHGYARFVFTDDLGKPLSMLVEDAVTATLDAVAADLGYTATGDGGAGSC